MSVTFLVISMSSLVFRTSLMALLTITMLRLRMRKLGMQGILSWVFLESMGVFLAV